MPGTLGGRDRPWDVDAIAAILPMCHTTAVFVSRETPGGVPVRRLSVWIHVRQMFSDASLHCTNAPMRHFECHSGLAPELSTGKAFEQVSFPDMSATETMSLGFD